VNVTQGGNEAPSIAHDVISPAVARVGQMGEGIRISTSQYFTDVDGDDLEYSLSGQPTGSGLGIDVATGVVTGQLTIEDVSQRVLLLIVTASDEYGGSASILAALTVVRNSQPVANGAFSGVVLEGREAGLQFGGLITDPDGAADLEFTAAGLPTGTGLIFSQEGWLGGVANQVDFDSSPLRITVTATDSKGLTASEIAIVEVVGA
jgi:hypothetical protein